MAVPHTRRIDSALGLREIEGKLIGRFLVRKRLGEGGMGEVYLAEDTKLKRQVALKRVSMDLRKNPHHRERFLKEAERASSLNDPHIASIYDVFEDDCEMFVVMELVDGITLRERMLRGALSVEDFLQIARECSQALASAHGKAIVHRDIKPENIMITTAGHVKILDFGVARRIMPSQGRETSTGDDDSTVGGISGTPAYMAPEVLLEKEADGRADLFSLGVVFYEALTGIHPFRAASFLETCDNILHLNPPGIHGLRPDLPVGAAPVLAQMLAKELDARTATASELRAQIEAIQSGLPAARLGGTHVKLFSRGKLAVAAIITLLVALAFPVVLWRSDLQPAGPTSARHLAVLQFSVIGGDEKLRAFAAGLTESVTAKLTQLTSRNSLQVAPARTLRDDNIQTIESARVGLGVNVVLEGTILLEGERIHLTYSVVDAVTKRNVNAETLNIPREDAWQLEDRIVQGAVQMLALQLEPSEQLHLARRDTQIPKAYDFYTQGRGYLREYDRPENLEAAIREFGNALQADQNYALAFTGLGEAYWRKYVATRDRAWIQKARANCERAIELNESLAEAHNCFGTLYTGTGKYESAAKEFELAIQHEPTSDEAHRGLGRAYESLAFYDKAEAAYRQAIQLRSHYWAGYTWLGAFLSRRARYGEAIDEFRHAIALAPDNANAYRSLGGLYYYVGRYPEAVQALEKSIQLRPDAVAYSNLGYNLASMQRYPEAVRAFERAREMNPQNYIMAGNLARAYSWLPGGKVKAAAGYRETIQLAERALQVNARDADAQIMLAFYYASVGDKVSSSKHLQAALRNSPNTPEFAFQAALTCAVIGQQEEVLNWLATAVKSGHSKAEIESAPEFSSLRSNPRFKQLLASRPQ